MSRCVIRIAGINATEGLREHVVSANKGCVREPGDCRSARREAVRYFRSQCRWTSTMA